MKLRLFSAFTLIELLVVLAIIGALATLIFPVLGKVTGQLHDTKCLSNMRQIGMVIQSAAAENNGNYPSIENDPNDPIHKPEDGKVWTMPELMKVRGASADILKCPADLRAKLARTKDSSEGKSYFETKGSSYEWYPLYEGENMNAPRRMMGDTVRVFPPSRVRLLMDYAESGEAPHDRTPDASSLHVYYADGSVRTIPLVKTQSSGGSGHGG